MNANFHPTAVIHPSAQIAPGVVVGPHAVIDEHVVLGPECRVGPLVHLTGNTAIGGGNTFHAGCVIGDAPQDVKYQNEPTRLVIGENNTFREHVTVHRSNTLAEDTVIGSENYLMAHSHVGHNSRLGNRIILANGALIGGHVIVEDRVFISGNCLVHQFVRLGRFALMQGGSAISKDLPPCTIARGDNGICGLNVVGLRRAGMSAAERTQLKKLYHLLFRSGLPLKRAIAEGRAEFGCETARWILDFVASTKRGLCADTGKTGSAETAEAD
jgi:UDP-N-acetylglucosamine acyltransferase